MTADATILDSSLPKRPEVGSFAAASRGQQWFEMFAGGLAVVSAAATFTVISGFAPFQANADTVEALLTLNVILALLLAGLIGMRVLQLWAQRRSGAAGSVIHMQLVTVFGLVAVVPTVVVAVFAAMLLNLGVNTWFSERVQAAIGNAALVAEGYVREHRTSIRADVEALAADLNQFIVLPEDDPRFQGDFGNLVFQRGLSAAAIFDEAGQPKVGARFTYMIDIQAPDADAIQRAQSRDVIYLNTGLDDRVEALVKLRANNRYLLAVRYIDSDVLANRRNVVEAASEYQRLEGERYNLQLTFASVYALVGLLVLLAAVSTGLSAANRIVMPIGELIRAAGSVSSGDLSVRVAVPDKSDELSTLSSAFNQMTADLRTQQKALVAANETAEERRRFSEAVLEGVSAGVLGLAPDGKIEASNQSAAHLLGLSAEAVRGRRLGEVVPEFNLLFGEAQSRADGQAADQIDLIRGGKTRNLTVRIAMESAGGEREGYVITFDDMTALVSAQRNSAWADVARRIAHEIKNPLTPIQLSAERLRRKYAKEVRTDPEVFEQCTDTIIRQVGDIGRMVDEFSSFARMPAPVMVECDLNETVRQAVFLQRVGNPAIDYELVLPDGHADILGDERLIVQALTNILKNAGEAVLARFGEGMEGGLIETAVEASGEDWLVSVTDNGIGLPTDDRERLTEPYMTTRAKGTGLGLAIVRKVVEDHGGRIVLDDAPDRSRSGRAIPSGARVTIAFPRRGSGAGPKREGPA